MYVFFNSYSYDISVIKRKIVVRIESETCILTSAKKSLEWDW